MRPRDANRLIQALADFAPSSKVFPEKRDLAGEVWAALMSAGKPRLAAEVLDMSHNMRGLQMELSDQAWDEHEIEVPLGSMSLTDVVGGRIVHLILEENHGKKSGDLTVEFPGDRTVPGTWSVKVAAGAEGEPSVLRVDIPSMSNSDVAAIAQALVEGCPDIGADTYQYP